MTRAISVLLHPDTSEVLKASLKSAICLLAKDKNDEEIAAEKPLQVHVGFVNAADFSVILRKNALPLFIQYVATCADTQSCLDEYIEALKDMPDKGSGALLEKQKTGRCVVYA